MDAVVVAVLLAVVFEVDWVQAVTSARVAILDVYKRQQREWSDSTDKHQ